MKGEVEVVRGYDVTCEELIGGGMADLLGEHDFPKSWWPDEGPRDDDSHGDGLGVFVGGQKRDSMSRARRLVIWLRNELIL